MHMVCTPGNETQKKAQKINRHQKFHNVKIDLAKALKIKNQLKNI